MTRTTTSVLVALLLWGVTSTSSAVEDFIEPTPNTVRADFTAVNGDNTAYGYFEWNPYQIPTYSGGSNLTNLQAILGESPTTGYASWHIDGGISLNSTSMQEMNSLFLTVSNDWGIVSESTEGIDSFEFAGYASEGSGLDTGVHQRIVEFLDTSATTLETLDAPFTQQDFDQFPEIIVSLQLLGDTSPTNFTMTSWQVTELTPVPLPPAAWLLGSSIIGLVGMARRKKGVR